MDKKLTLLEIQEIFAIGNSEKIEVVENIDLERSLYKFDHSWAGGRSCRAQVLGSNNEVIKLPHSNSYSQNGENTYSERKISLFEALKKVNASEGDVLHLHCFSNFNGNDYDYHEIYRLKKEDIEKIIQLFDEKFNTPIV